MPVASFLWLAFNAAVLLSAKGKIMTDVSPAEFSEMQHTIAGETKDTTDAEHITHLMMNRMGKGGKHWGNMTDILNEKGQFQARGKPEYEKSKTGKYVSAWEKGKFDAVHQAVQRAHDAHLRGEDSTGGATFYHHGDVEKLSPASRDFFKGLTPTKTVGNLHLYKEK